MKCKPLPNTLGMPAVPAIMTMHGVEVAFEANHWMYSATREELLDLQKVDWSGDYAADEVARYERSYCVPVDTLFNTMEILNAHRSRDKIGFEVWVDRGAAMLWLRRHRVDVYTYLVENGEDEVEGGGVARYTIEQATEADHFCPMCQAVSFDPFPITVTCLICGKEAYAGCCINAELGVCRKCDDDGRGRDEFHVVC